VTSSPSTSHPPHRCQIAELDLPLLRPTTVTELSQTVREGFATSTAVYPVGGGTRVDLGRCPDKPGTAVDLRGLDQVIDYPSADMTITVRCGITMARLGEILAEKGQRLPVESHDPARETLGGLIACNGSGPRRLGHGTMRDYVIGIKYLNDQGEEAKAGGRVVKNVAGYDLCKLHTGALGTLGILTEVTLKLRPRVASRAVLLVFCEPARLESLAQLIHDSATRPVSVDALNASACRHLAKRGWDLPDQGPHWLVGIGLEDNPDANRWQINQLTRELAAFGKPLVWEEGQADSWWAALSSLCPGQQTMALRWTLPASKIAGQLPVASDLPESPLVLAHLANGIGRIHLDETLPVSRAAEITAKLRKTALERGGNLVMERGSVSYRKVIPVWGEPRPDHELARRIHREFDPRGIFNPGRFLSGI